ncbi:MAG TPA: type II toxin-antitoxin system VapC family toxin [Terriglobia bacterium]|nr:type II toxin-antitoxin system VapC family toxin [Terriglobia bacterium]
MQSTQYRCRAHYLDASALVKLVADDSAEEPGRSALRKYYHENPNMYATSYSITEALSAFKRKFLHEEIDQAAYLKYVSNFITQVIGGKLKIDEVHILKPDVLREAERLINLYHIDFLDCFQIVTILHGTYCVLGPQSRSILITADRDLAEAARKEGASVWECTSEPAPV